jgi:hypothetical protein
MPQQKKHHTNAARQQAYRARCEQARQNAMAAKGLPSLPAIAALPGWARWNASFTVAHALVANSLREMQDYFDDRSDAWQESERGEDHHERIASAEAALEALDELIQLR